MIVLAKAVGEFLHFKSGPLFAIIWRLVTLKPRNKSVKPELRSLKGNQRGGTDLLEILIIVGAIIAVVGVSLIEMQNDDRRLQELNAELSKAEKAINKTDKAIREHKVLKSRLQKRLDKLETRERELEQSSWEIFIKDLDEVDARLHEPLGTFTKNKMIADNLSEQITALTQIRSSAASVGDLIDSHLRELSERLVAAEKLVVDSQKALMNTIKIVLDPNPNQAAKAQLDKTLKQRKQKLLAQLGIDPKLYDAVLRNSGSAKPRKRPSKK